MIGLSMGNDDYGGLDPFLVEARLVKGP